MAESVSLPTLLQTYPVNLKNIREENTELTFHWRKAASGGFNNIIISNIYATLIFKPWQ